MAEIFDMENIVPNTNYPNEYDLTDRLKLTKFANNNYVNFGNRLNSDLEKIDKHGHFIISDTEPESLPDDGSVLWYNTTNKVIYTGIGGTIKPLVDVVNSLDSDEVNKPLSAAAGSLIKQELDKRSSIYKSDLEHGVSKKPTSLILKVSDTKGAVTGFSDSMQISPNMGVRLLKDDEESKYI